jgi:hypothetical protein
MISDGPLSTVCKAWGCFHGITFDSKEASVAPTLDIILQERSTLVTLQMFKIL